MSLYTDHDDVGGDGAIVLYKRKNLKKPKWQVRLKIPGAKGYKVLSTGLTDKTEAIQWSQKKYYELSYLVERGGSLNAKTFGQVFAEWCDYYRSTNAENTGTYIEGNISIVERVFLPTLRNQKIDALTDADLVSTLVAYKGRRNDREIDVSGRTRASYKFALLRLYDYAVAKQYVPTQPTIKIGSGKSNARPHFHTRDWKKLTNFMTRWVDEIKSKPNKNGYDFMRLRQRTYLQHYCLVMANTGCRVGEMRNVTWSNLSPTSDIDGTPSVILSVKGKTGRRNVIAQPVVVEYLQRLLDFRANELGLSKTDFQSKRMNEPIFCSPDGKPVGSYKKSFNTLIESAGVAYAPDGQKRVIYSLRHTYAVFRITAKTPLFQLASNMGTDIRMLMDFYGSHLPDDPAYVSSVTQSNQQTKGAPLSFLDG